VKNDYLPWSKKQHEAHPKTYIYYRVSSKPLKSFFGKARLEEITTGQVEKFKLNRAEQVSPATTNRDLAAPRAMLNYAIRHEYITRNLVTESSPAEGPG